MESEDNNSWLHLADLEVFSTSNQSTPSRRERSRKSPRSRSSSERGRSRTRQRSLDRQSDVGTDDQLILNLANSRFEFSALRISNHAHTQLTHLNLSQNNLQAIPLDTLRPLRQLKMLNLSHNFIDSMWGLHFQVKLEYLDISNNWIDHVEGLHRCRSLKVLDLAQNQIAEIEALHELALLPRIKVLDLSSNPISARPEKQKLVCRLLPQSARVAGFPPCESAAPLSTGASAQSSGDTSSRLVPMSASAWSAAERKVGELDRNQPHMRAKAPAFDQSPRIAHIKACVDSVKKRFEKRDKLILDAAQHLPPPLHDRRQPASKLGPAVVAALRTMKKSAQESVERIRAWQEPDIFAHFTDSTRKKRLYATSSS
eukprot:INCI18190.1.p1 GENE.INCI18190.1~~INCI18190.1.p1  ORF type:complete len:371 (+),score=51.59 INCI18190.1:249-1361(+)